MSFLNSSLGQRGISECQYKGHIEKRQTYSLLEQDNIGRRLGWDKRFTKCGHVLCYECFERLKGVTQCPVCGKKFNGTLDKNYTQLK